MYLSIINFEDVFDPERVITASEMLEKTKDKKEKKFDDNSIFSEKIFGTWDDYDNISNLAWVDLGSYKIINPIGYFRLEKLFRKDNLKRIISFNKETNAEGEFVENEENDDFNLGMLEFEEKFEYFLEKYGNQDKDEYNTVLKMYNDGTLFINKFPILHPKMRPGILLNSTLVYDDINKFYNLLIRYNNEIKELEKEEVDKEDSILSKLELLFQIQYNANRISEYIINKILKGKKGLFRKTIIGTRLNYSSRLLIVPKTDGSVNQIDIPYVAFLELFKFPLVNLMYNTENLSPNYCYEYIENAKNYFDKKLYKYMIELKDNTKMNIRFMLSRNPVINIGSILCLSLDKIKEDYTDFTMSISNTILKTCGVKSAPLYS